MNLQRCPFCKRMKAVVHGRLNDRVFIRSHHNPPLVQWFKNTEGQSRPDLCPGSRQIVTPG